MKRLRVWVIDEIFGWWNRLRCKIWQFDDEPDNPGVPLHVYPLNDLVAHDTDGGDCVCGPRDEPVERDDGSIGWLVVHRALDGRR